jgi:hypothetical protein
MPSDNSNIMRYYRETEQRQMGRRLTREDIRAMSRKILEDSGMVLIQKMMDRKLNSQ